MQGYNKIDKFIHQHCQTIAKFGRSFGESKKDDSHTNLNLDQIGKTIWGRWVHAHDSRCMLGLDLAAQEFKLVDTNKAIIASFKLKGNKQSDVELEMAHYFKKSESLEGDDFLKPLHYEIPSYDFLDELILKYHIDQLDAWFHYRFLANHSGLLLLDYLQSATEIRIWPHHCDTEISFEYNNENGPGFGWAMADSIIPEAYYYYTIHGLNNYTVNYDNTYTLSVG